MLTRTTKNTIQFIGYMFIIIGLVDLLFYIANSDNVILDKGFKYFFAINILYYSFIGVGLVQKQKWAFIGFKLFLFMLYISFPIGTYFAYKIKKRLIYDGVYDYFSK